MVFLCPQPVGPTLGRCPLGPQRKLVDLGLELLPAASVRGDRRDNSSDLLTPAVGLLLAYFLSALLPLLEPRSLWRERRLLDVSAEVAVGAGEFLDEVFLAVKSRV
ncbi:MAG: hypothetical protein EBR82_44840 [Caulobacteraceae bacterium]|nr:hypothetical protein [Caulobacteraceae bacterium]